jgi:pimeloyl-ACP methyl ester carboxylesterase
MERISYLDLLLIFQRFGIEKMGLLTKFWKTLLAGGAGVAALAAVNASIARNVTEPDEIFNSGEDLIFKWKHGRIFYKRVGNRDAAPLLLVHGIGVGASNYMWRRNLKELSNHFQLFAIDLLGFGLSDKPPTAPYSAALYTELIADFIKEVIGKPTSIVASSLSGAYAIHVADSSPELIKSLILIAPTGSDVLRDRPRMRGAAFYGLLHSPVLGTSFYNAVASERAIKEQVIEELFFNKELVTDRLISQYYALSHQPGAHYAIAAFLSGYLNTDIREPFKRLSQQTILVWGKQDIVNPIAQATALLSLNSKARLMIFDQCRMMPQEEYPKKFNKLLLDTLLDRPVAIPQANYR